MDCKINVRTSNVIIIITPLILLFNQLFLRHLTTVEVIYEF